MVVYGYSRQNSFAVEQTGSIWDPSAVLGIINPDTRGFTCVGYAPSCGRRCRNPIAQHNRQNVFDMLDKIALLSPGSRAVSSKLPEIAYLALCVRYHKVQVNEVVTNWQRKLDALECSGARERERSRDRTDFWNTTPKIARERLHVPISKEPTITRIMEVWKDWRQESKREEQENNEKEREWEEVHKEMEEEMEKLQEMQERLMRRMKEVQKRQEEGKGMDEREREREREREKEREREREREREKEREREREQERERKREKEKEEEERKQRDRDRATENERIRKAAERRREEAKRLKRLEAARQKKEWEEAWKNYTSGWEIYKARTTSSTTTSTPFPASTTQTHNHATIPWPVKSGQYRDVAYAAVRDFFTNAAPDAADAALIFRLMQRESLKWHPDKMGRLFGGAVGPAEEMVVNVIMRVVLELRSDAQRRRGG